MIRVWLLMLFVLATLSSTWARLRGANELEDGYQQGRKLVNLQSYGGDPPANRFPLLRCEGDCDNDMQCKDDLVCYQRNKNEAVPGCTGGEQDGSRTDYCVRPSDLAPNPKPTAAPVASPTPKPTITPVASPTLKPTVAPVASPTPKPTPIPTTPAPTPKPNPSPVPGPINSSGGPPLVSYGGTPPGGRFPLGECEGDCDYDTDCQTGLRCHMRSNFDPTPGCSGNDASRTDYCVKIDPNAPPPPTPPSPTPPSPTPPSGSPAPLSDFRLKLYWQQGYFWQEETIERLWCMQCRNNGCDFGDKLYIKTCGSSNQRFDFVQATNDYILIQLHGTNLCLERDFKDIFLMTCNASSDLQLWFEQQGSFDGPRFEISPKTLSNHCITQRHHPKADEEVELEPCTLARHGETSYWNRF